MTFLRVLLIFVLVYYLLKIIGRSLLSRNKKENVRAQDSKNIEAIDYSDKTDQKIEDADFEDLK